MIVDLAEAQIAVHWKEEELVPPPDSFVRQVNHDNADIDQRFALENFPECFNEYAEMLAWTRKWDTTLDDSTPPFWKWFTGGLINAGANCVDRHLPASADKAAFIFVPELESEPQVTLTYRSLYERVNETAAVLRDLCGLQRGDRVTLYLPNVPELPITMLACARLGVIHAAIAGDAGSYACGQRIADSESRILITVDGYNRGGELVDQKSKADLAVAAAAQQGRFVEKVLVWRRTPSLYMSDSPMMEGRDLFMNDVVKRFAGARVDPLPMPAEAPLFLMYTSGATGKPKDCQHSTGGYLAYVAGTARHILDLQPDDVYWCMADLSAITGHSYVVYAPLALGTTSVIYEGEATYPDPGRLWRIAERLGVNVFHTAATVVRMLRRSGPEEPEKYDLRFKLIATTGEPIEPDVWRWYYDAVGRQRAVVVDAWWQSESGGFLCATRPSLPMKPGSAGPGAPGIHPVIFDEEGNELPCAAKAGSICIRNPWPGLMQTIWRDPDRYVKTYYAKYCRNPASKDWRDWPYFAGDGALCGADHYYRILGRVDDIINVAGHRLAAKELESACLTLPEVAEAAVVPVADEARGRVPEVYITLTPGTVASDAIEAAVAGRLETLIGKIARPKSVRIVPDMPKTRSGRIVRRLLAAISNKTPLGDTGSVANPEVVEQIRFIVHGTERSRRPRRG